MPISLPKAKRIVEAGGIILPGAERDLRKRLNRERKKLGQLFKRNHLEAETIENVSETIRELETVLALNKVRKKKIP